ncbi:MAG: tetratricopeptide repeat protein, partial [Anaerolineales bacterium]
MSSGERISRNAPCPCGSGLRYKKCCGSKTLPSDMNPGAGRRDQRGAIFQNAPVEQQPTYVSGTASTAGAISASHAEQMYSDAMMLRTSGRIEAAKEKYEEILRIWPEEVRAISSLGYCLVQLGQRERGLEEAKRAVELDPDGLISIMELALILFNLGEVEDSLKWAKRAVKLGPHGANANSIIANCYERTHRIEQALAANKLAQSANPQNKWLKLQEAKLIARNGDHEKAKDILRETTGVPGLPPELRGQVFSELGRVLDNLHRYDQAYEAFVQSGLEASRTPEAQRFKL